MELTPALLERAYSAGMFPMPDRFGIIRWYQPDPRAILPLDAFHVSRSLRRKLRKTVDRPQAAGGRRDAARPAGGTPALQAPALFEVSYDHDFAGVMRGCANRKPTWITPEFIRAYTALHRLGKAHSVEVWQGSRLVGGTYGVHLGGAFFAESKFHTVTDASKVALAKLAERLSARGFALLEVQFLTPHLAQFGVIEIPHTEYMRRLEAALKLTCEF
ncbi:MAG: leucyl/phenylalanyl-tRNA--protein transferase [Planctomycetota bacterium]|nr:leucyl/phenylalanyl-tRNA--protein transferase [Planctomycetota bacterium]